MRNGITTERLMDKDGIQISSRLVVNDIEIGDQVSFRKCYSTSLLKRFPNIGQVMPMIDEYDGWYTSGAGYVVGVRNVIMSDIEFVPQKTATILRKSSRAICRGKKEQVLMVSLNKFRKPVIVRLADIDVIRHRTWATNCVDTESDTATCQFPAVHDCSS